MSTSTEIAELRAELARLRPVYDAAEVYIDHEHLHRSSWPLDIFRQALIDAVRTARAQLAVPAAATDEAG